MLILLNIFRAFALILNSVITIFLVILFARVVLSWIRLPYNPVIQAIYAATEPILRPIRKRLPVSWGIDFSPMIVFMILLVLRIVVVDSMLDYVHFYRERYLHP